MPFVTTTASIRYHQMSLEEVLDAAPNAAPRAPVGKPGDTRTVFYETLPSRLSNPYIASRCIAALDAFVKKWEHLYGIERHALYRSFKIPKASGGWRQIDAPQDDLMDALRELKELFEEHFFASHHTAAFAYAKKRCALSAVQKHQANQSRWFLKTDCSDFFGSTTPAFVFKMLNQIWPFSEVLKLDAGKELLHKALDLAFLNGGLPQGTPLSPTLTNIIMIPIDHYLYHAFRNFNGQTMVYTRYADDIDISCRKSFMFMPVVQFLRDTFAKFEAPYQIKQEKTHYGSANGRNWILGVMYNKDLKITIGARKKQIWRSMMNEYLKRRTTSDAWDLHSIQELQGLTNYYRKIEPDYFDFCLKRFGDKYHINVIRAIRDDIRGA